MTKSDWIALGALLISAGSLFVSRMAFKQSDIARRRSEALRAREVKVEVLGLISECRSILHRTYTEIGALKADFDHEKQPVQVLLQNYATLFSKYLPSTISALETMEDDWATVHAWTDEISHDDLLRRKAELQDKLNDFRFSNDVAVGLISEFRGKMDEARSYADGATR